jgi:hypothetical protein
LLVLDRGLAGRGGVGTVHGFLGMPAREEPAALV